MITNWMYAACETESVICFFLVGFQKLGCKRTCRGKVGVIITSGTFDGSTLSSRCLVGLHQRRSVS